MTKARLELLQRMPIFGGIRDDTLEFLLDQSPIISASKGNFFFHEKDKGASMYVLEEGKVAILKTWKGHDYLLSYLEKGDCFGEMELIDLCPRSASVLAVEDCRAIEMSSTALYKVYKSDPEQFAMIHMNMGREVSRRLRKSDEQLFQAKVEANIIAGDFTRLRQDATSRTS